jgi:hypothetical protein
VWVAWFDPEQLRTQAEVVSLTQHCAVGNLLSAAVRKLKARNEANPPSESEQALINLALSVTGANTLDEALKIRKLAVWSQVLARRHLRIHQRKSSLR